MISEPWNMWYFGKPLLGLALLCLVFGWLWVIHYGPLSFPEDGK